MGTRNQEHVSFPRPSLGTHPQDQRLLGEAQWPSAFQHPNNIMGKHCFKFSGLANAEVVGVQETDAQRGITLTKKIKKNGQNPKKNIVAVDLKKGMRHVAKSITARTDGAFYRRDLSKPALARWYKIWKAQNRATESSE